MKGSSSRSILSFKSPGYLVLALAWLIAGAGGTSAATINVDTTADTVATDGACSLREAVNNVNATADTTGGDCAAGDGTADTIILPAGTYTLTGAILEDLNASGDLDISKAVTIQGAGATATFIDGNGTVTSDRVIHVTAAVTLTLDGVTITGGSASTDGGGIYSSGAVTVTNSTISGNSAVLDSGGIFSVGAVTVTDSTISGNSATFNFGGIYSEGALLVTDSTISANSAGNHVGGIFSNSAVTVTNSTISGNSAVNDSGGIFSNGAVTVTNSTVSGNSAGLDGGGIYSKDVVTLTNSTITGNSAPTGGGVYAASGTITLTNSIIAGNTGGDCAVGGGSFSSSGGNIDSDNSCNLLHATDLPGQTTEQINLGPLADNGGSTFTHALLTGSVAIDAANGCAGLTEDQRGTTRPSGSGCDIGAYEYSSFNEWPVATSPSGDSVSALPTFTWADSTAGGPYQLLVLNSVGTSVINKKNITSCVAGTCSWTRATALAAGMYQWKVRSVNGGNGPWSGGPVFVVGGSGASSLSAPETTSPITGTTGNNTPSFTWTEVAGAASYQLLVVDSSGLAVFNVKNITSCAAGTCTSTPGTLSAGLHMWKVRAADGSGWGPWSAMPRFTAP